MFRRGDYRDVSGRGDLGQKRLNIAEVSSAIIVDEGKCTENLRWGMVRKLNVPLGIAINCSNVGNRDVLEKDSFTFRPSSVTCSSFFLLF